MAVFYRLYQNNNENFVNKGKWYARATMTETVDMKKLAERIQRNCTAKRSDVWAVLTELVEVMQDELQASRETRRLRRIQNRHPEQGVRHGEGLQCRQARERTARHLPARDENQCRQDPHPHLPHRMHRAGSTKKRYRGITGSKLPKVLKDLKVLTQKLKSTMKNINQSKWRLILKAVLAIITALLGVIGGTAVGIGGV